VVWHVGTEGSLPPGVAHHNLHFGRAWADSFRALFRDGVRMPDPSLLVSVPTLDDPSLAPSGHQVLYVLEPVPNLDGRVDWMRERSQVRHDLEAHLVRLGYPTDIEVERLVDPLDWEADGMERGTPFALAHTFTQTGPFRPRNVERRAPGLVFTGSGTVPGVGVPMVLVSGELAAARVTSGGAP
jgi:phytoene desaturase